MRFSNKVAILTGAGSGIGKETARRLVEEGAKVAINGRNKAKLEAAAKEIDPNGKNIAILAGDIALPTTSRALVNLPHTAQTAGIVVTRPTTVSVAPTAFRCSAVSLSARRSAIPAPSMARVTIVNASSGKLRWGSFTNNKSTRWRPGSTAPATLPTGSHAFPRSFQAQEQVRVPSAKKTASFSVSLLMVDNDLYKDSLIPPPERR
jgi:hypothetical protein